jgi:replicative DNA helicase
VTALDDAVDTRTPPSDVAAERSILGAMLQSRAAVLDVSDRLTGPEFYRPAHEVIYAAIRRLHDAEEPIDPVTVANRLRADGDLSRCGGGGYLADLFGSTPTAANASYYARIVADLAARRRLIEAGARIAQLAWSTDGADLPGLMGDARAEIDAATATHTGDRLRPFSEHVTEAFDRWDTPDATAIPTGWHDVDRMLNGGLRPGHLFVVAARPATGKSFAATLIASAAAMRGIGCLFVSLEMSSAEVTDRVVAAHAGVNLARMTTRTLDETDWERAARSHTKFLDWPLWIESGGGIGLAQVRSRARTTVRTGLGMIVIDYLQQLVPAGKAQSREQEVAAISRGLKRLATEFSVPVVAIAQVNRGPANRQDKRPVVTDLRESGSIEADADEIVLLHRDDEERPGEVEFHVAKNRHGIEGRVSLGWAPHQARITSLARYPEAS